MARPYAKFLTVYLAVSAALTLVVCIGVPGKTVRIADRHLHEAAAALSAGQPEEALVRLNRITHWAALLPPQWAHLNGLSIQAHAARSDYASAAGVARAYFARPRGGAVRKGLWPALAASLTPMAGTLFLHTRPTDAPDRWLGYKMLASELARRGEYDRLDLEKEMLERGATFLKKPSRAAPVQVAMTRTPPKPEPSAPVTAPSPTEPAPPPAVEPAAEPAPDGQKSEVAWGVITASPARAYTVDGREVGRFDLGTLLEFAGLTNTTAGRMALCRTLAEDGSPMLALVRAADADIRPGALANADEREKDLRIRQAQLRADIARMRKEPGSDAANPHRAEYLKARSAYARFAKQAEKLTAQRDKATEAQREKISDELWSMRGEGVRLKEAYQKAKQEYADWNASHPNIDGADVTALEQELASVRGHLDRFFPDKR